MVPPLQVNVLLTETVPVPLRVPLPNVNALLIARAPLAVKVPPARVSGLPMVESPAMVSEPPVICKEAAFWHWRPAMESTPVLWTTVELVLMMTTSAAVGSRLLLQFRASLQRFVPAPPSQDTAAGARRS